jgi:hypothetical protein
VQTDPPKADVGHEQRPCVRFPRPSLVRMGGSSPPLDAWINYRNTAPWPDDHSAGGTTMLHIVRRFWRRAPLALAAFVLLAPVGTAHAQTPNPHRASTWVLTEPTAESYSGTVQLSFTGLTTEQLESLGRPVSSQEDAQPAILPPPSDGGSYFTAKCDHYYEFSDYSGTFSYQHGCTASTSPWGYRISSALQSIATGSVHEAGLSWTRNGTVQPRQSPHVESVGYLFHGTFNPLRNGDRLTYDDDFSFPIRVGASTGTAHIHITGAILQSSSR